MENRVLATNIQRFSIHDGPGIRTTVFLKGCVLHCPWCANPENLHPYPEEYVKDGRKGIYGKYYSCEELFNEITKDRIFYDQPDGIKEPVKARERGGVTFSGGEPLLQFNVLEPLLARLRSEQIHICVETSLFVPDDRLSIALKYVDLFYVDIKILDEEKCEEILGGELRRYYFNLDAISEAGKSVIFRVPVIGDFTDGGSNIDGIADILKKYKTAKVELIKEHNLGKSKYISLGKTAPKLDKITDADMENIKESIRKKTGASVEICKI